MEKTRYSYLKATRKVCFEDLRMRRPSWDKNTYIVFADFGGLAKIDKAKIKGFICVVSNGNAIPYQASTEDKEAYDWEEYTLPEEE